jgi:hypothetical protein
MEEIKNIKTKYSKIKPKQISDLIKKNKFSFISGPISFISFDDNGRKIYLFGDEHFDKKGNCETDYKNVKISCLQVDKHNSKKKVCYDFVYFLEKLFNINEKSKEYIDFYLETPFQKRYMRQEKTGDVDYITSIEKVFKKCFLRNKSKCKFKKTRFHYIDFRIKNVKTVSSITYILVNFIQTIKKQINHFKDDKKKIKIIKNKIRFYDILAKRLYQKKINQKLLQSYFEDNFRETMNKIFKQVTRGLNQKKYKRYLIYVKKVFKQASNYYKIRNKKKVHLIKSQLDALRKEGVQFKNHEMADLIEEFVKKNYNNKVDLVLFQSYFKDYIVQLNKYIKNKNIDEYDEYNKKINQFLMGSIIEMDAHIFDAYLLGRLFRTFKYTKRKKHIPSKTIVIYAGNYHIQNYVNFFVDVLGMKPEIMTGPINKELKRCIYSPKLKQRFTL